MFLTNSLRKGVPYNLVCRFLAAGATSLSLRPRSRVSQLGYRSFIVEPNQQNSPKEDREKPRQDQQTQQEIPTGDYLEPPSTSRGISPYLTGLLVVGFGLTAYGV